MAEVHLTFEQREFILKCYWKFEDVCEVQRPWRREFATEPSTRLTISRILDKLFLTGVLCKTYASNEQGDLTHQAVL
jgi:hypothetical protein